MTYSEREQEPVGFSFRVPNSGKTNILTSWTPIEPLVWGVGDTTNKQRTMADPRSNNFLMFIYDLTDNCEDREEVLGWFDKEPEEVGPMENVVELLSYGTLCGFIENQGDYMEKGLARWRSIHDVFQMYLSEDTKNCLRDTFFDWCHTHLTRCLRFKWEEFRSYAEQQEE